MMDEESQHLDKWIWNKEKYVCKYKTLWKIQKRTCCVHLITQKSPDHIEESIEEDNKGLYCPYKDNELDHFHLKPAASSVPSQGFFLHS